jgi:hypothetical protein
MTAPVGSVSASAATQGTAPTAAAQNALPPGVRLPSSRIDFRSLLRDETSAREPVGRSRTVRPLGAIGPVVSIRSVLAGSTPIAGLSKAQGEDGLARARVDARDDDPLDPMSRHHASLGPPEALFAPSAPALALQSPLAFHPIPPTEVATARAASSLEELLPQLVRRVAWSGDGRRGSMRMEIGAGHLAGSTLLVHAEDGRVRVELDIPPDVDASGWQDRIRQRLEARGIAADSVEVK